MDNPYYVAELRQHQRPDRDRPVVRAGPAGGAALPRAPRGAPRLRRSRPTPRTDGPASRSAIGCTGGYHRSIVVVEELAAWLRDRDLGNVAVFHRELDRA